MTDDVKEYFLEKYGKASFKVAPGHWPDFKTKEEVDEWINKLEKAINKAFSKTFGD